MLVLKDVLYLVQNLVLQGGEEFQPDKYLTDRNMYYPSHEFNTISLIGSYSFEFCYLLRNKLLR